VRDSPVPTETPESCTVFDSEDQPIRVIDQIRKIRVHSGLLLRQTVLHSVENKGMGIAFTSMQVEDQAILENGIEKLRRP